MIKFRLFFGFILLFMLIVFSSCIFNPPLPDVCVDGDGDGFGVNCDSGLDCDDSNANVYEEISCSYDGSVCGAFSLCLDSCPVPPAEICGNDVDEDCDGEDLDCPVVCEDLDNDGFGVNCDSGLDCDDGDVSINPDATEICGNDVDEDCDGVAEECEVEDPEPVLGTAYYISNSGDDSNDGLSESAPWKTLAKLQEEENSGTFEPGDAILFKRGDMWREKIGMFGRLQPKNNGEEGKPITYGAYGVGEKPVFNGAKIMKGWTQHSNNVWKIPHTYQHSRAGQYILFVDGVPQELVGSISEVDKTGEYFIDVTAPATIYFYSTVNPDNLFVEVPNADIGFRIEKNQYLVFKNLEFKYHRFAGLDFFGPQPEGNIVVDGCEFYYNYYGGIRFWEHHKNLVINSVADYNGNGFYSVYSDNITYINDSASNSIPSGTDGHGFGLQDSADNLVENCYSYRNNQGIAIDDMHSSNTNIIRNNRVEESIMLSNGVAIGSLGEKSYIEIYNNIFTHNSPGSGLEVYFDNYGKVNFHHNIIYDPVVRPPLPWNYYSAVVIGETRNIEFKNNIVYTSQEYGGFLSIRSSTVDMDNNVYYAPNARTFTRYDGVNLNTFDGWKQASGQDANSVYGDPLFVDPENGNFRLKSDSPAHAIDAGVIEYIW